MTGLEEPMRVQCAFGKRGGGTYADSVCSFAVLFVAENCIINENKPVIGIIVIAEC